MVIAVVRWRRGTTSLHRTVRPTNVSVQPPRSYSARVRNSKPISVGRSTRLTQRGSRQGSSHALRYARRSVRGKRGYRGDIDGGIDACLFACGLYHPHVLVRRDRNECLLPTTLQLPLCVISYMQYSCSSKKTHAFSFSPSLSTWCFLCFLCCRTFECVLIRERSRSTHTQDGLLQRYITAHTNGTKVGSGAMQTYVSTGEKRLEVEEKR